MNETDNKISEILEIEYQPEELEISSNGYLSIIKEHEISAVLQPEENNHVEVDADFARDKVYDLIAQGEVALDLIEKISIESHHPRSLEVMGQLLKTQSDNIDKLLKIQKEKKELSKELPPQRNQAISIDKAVFVGNTSDLLKKIRQDNP